MRSFRWRLAHGLAMVTGCAGLLATAFVACGEGDTPPLDSAGGGSVNEPRTVAQPPDGAVVPDAGADAPAPRLDGSMLEDARPLTDIGPASCNLLAQHCPINQGCYPGVGNSSTCQIAGVVADGAPCASSPECEVGSVCPGAESGGAEPFLCQRLCSPQAPACPGQALCVALPGLAPLGYCSP